LVAIAAVIIAMLGWRNYHRVSSDGLELPLESAQSFRTQLESPLFLEGDVFNADPDET
jgi:hypothetical protein